ncbi:MAG TPA: bifunctional 5,10-methylenetetrahydrofolate dehydrogenase/5,10-methenyltetrahydrofolate cyclohydrolase [Aestuariivirga sp.]|nr:bifunctional 5,10-methylenetetrahydrofolate dehydrogenase/5,10-methenyltetrahydrofolate cyclohydrolase [Alphaproteobacteria bacterium]HRX35055.1 bifunctional 5,10-methylenetetrahydrofolate dehydrogenase/5,10-methenyltetrahydrofolate cyclohydrolase [Aestuariivirga sp.]
MNIQTAIRHNALLGRPVAEEITATVRDGVRDLATQGWPVKLVSITIGDVPAVSLYVRNQARGAEKAGILFEERNLPAKVSRVEMLGILAALNTDPRVTGIIIQRPVPKHLDVRELQTAIHPLKDVEGMHPSSIGNIVYRDTTLAPCTAAASVELLKRTGLKLEGLEVVVIGHSEIVGKPIAFLLMAEGATVTVCHHMTRNLAVHSRAADAIFVAVGKPRFITPNMIKPGSAVIDIGINQIEEGGKHITVGDVDYDACADVAGWITPVPGGVGPVTVSILMRNALTAALAQKRYYDETFAAKSGTLVHVAPAE